ncbi:hypothetical protein BSZ39_08655 [Bowdeniella nasicola]|uniref:Nuclease SbcCD subunit D n=1 Tax=Bowdeniella nasicola TaxID=208480 RepID=A0A1Q5Q1N4_9ACTO|nr:exonuclease subunit SbcD [Bowdeniella nasicola]OKL53615.1 hypothetical protein BSZ39_08655 [Bowdeniella nasicola]
MKLLHTADWHLGRTLHQVDLTEDHAAYLDHLVDLAADEQVDAVLVSGDIYDRAYPPVASVAQLNDALARLTDLTHVVLTAGNHDSAQRLGFLEGLTSDRLHLRTRPRSAAIPVSIPTSGGTLHIFALPFLDVDAARREFARPGGELPARSHEAVMAAALTELAPAIARARATGEGAVVIAAHAFVSGGEPSESERDIQVGGVDRIPAGVFDAADADYVALGHLHRPQNISAATPMRYSGSPIAFSFGEARDTKSSTIVEFSAAGARADATVRTVAAPVLHPLADLRGTLAELLAMSDVPAHARVKTVLTDAVRPPGAYQALKDKFPLLLAVGHEPQGTARESVTVSARELADPLAVVDTFLAYVTQAEVTDAQRAIVRDSYEALLAEERES